MAENPVSAIYEKGEHFMNTAFTDLFHEYLLFTIAVVLAVLPLLLFVFLRMKGKAYLFKDTTPWKGHRLLILSILISAGKNLWNVFNRSSDFTETGLEKKVEIAIGVMLALFALYVVFRLFFYKLSGVIGAFLYIWLFAGFKNFRGIALGFLQLPSILAGSGTKYRDFSLPERVGTYAMADYYITLAMTISFLALVLTLLLGVYYYRRRYIFCPSRLEEVPKCECCGKPAMKEDICCSNCGAKLQVRAAADPVLEALDTEHCCKVCGTILIGDNCITCSSGKTPSKTWKKFFQDVLKGEKSLMVIMLVVYVAYWFLLYGPEKLSLIHTLPANVPEQSQKYSDTYNELVHNPVLAGDETWRNRFGTDCELLYLYDAKWAYRDTRSLRSNDWKFYLEFGKASFEQMEVLEQTRSKVDALAEEFAEVDVVSEEQKGEIQAELDVLTAEFNRTVTDQETAQTEYLLHPISYMPIETLEYDLFDGFRFYLQYINTLLVAAALLAAAFLAAAYVLNRFSYYTPAMALEKWYMKCQKNNEKRVATVLPGYVTVEEKHRIAPRAGLVLTSLFCHIVRFFSELFMLILTLLTGIGIFLSLFRFRNIRRVKSWVVSRLKTPKTVFPEKTYGAYKKAKRRGRWKMLLWFCICLLVIHIWNITHKPKVDEVEVFMELSNDIYWENAPRISAHLVNIDNAGGIEEDVKDEITRLIEDELGDILALEKLKDTAGYETVREQYPEYWDGIFAFCSLDRAYLEGFQKSIEEGAPSDQASIEAYINLREEDFQWLIEICQGYKEGKTNEELKGIAEDFAD